MNHGTKNEWLSLTRTELLIYAAFFFNSIGVAAYIPYAPVWLKQIFTAESYFVLGLVSVIPNFFLAVGAPIWGRLADKFGTKIFVMIGYFSTLLMYVSLLLFSNTAMDFLIIILIGNAFVAAQLSNIYSMATLAIPKRKEVVLGKITIAMSLSWLITSPVAGLIRDSVQTMSASTKERWTAFFSRSLSETVSSNLDMVFQLSISVVAVTLALITISFVKNAPKSNSRSEIQKEKKKGKITDYPLLFVLVLIFTFTFQAASSGFWSFHSIYFYDILGMKGSLYSLFLIITTILGIGLSFLLGRIKKVFSHAIVIVIFMVLQFFTFFLMYLFPFNKMLVLMLYAIPMYTVFQIPLYAVVTSLSRKEFRSTAYGLYNSTGLVGGIIATLLLGFAADRVAARFFIIISSVLIIAVASLIEAVIMLIFLKKLHINNEQNNRQKLNSRE